METNVIGIRAFLASTTPIEDTVWPSVYNERIRRTIGAIPAAQRTLDEAATYDYLRLQLGAHRVLFLAHITRRGAMFESCLQAAVDYLAGERFVNIAW
jgi:hypothetical protein